MIGIPPPSILPFLCLVLRLPPITLFIVLLLRPVPCAVSAFVALLICPSKGLPVGANFRPGLICPCRSYGAGCFPPRPSPELPPPPRNGLPPPYHLRPVVIVVSETVTTAKSGPYPTMTLAPTCSRRRKVREGRLRFPVR